MHGAAAHNIPRRSRQVVTFAAGDFNISTTAVLPFDVSGIEPAPGASLVFRGAGMHKTTLRFDGVNNTIEASARPCR